MPFPQDAQSKGMKYALYDGFFFQIFFTLTSSFLTAFALYLGAGNTYIGVLNALPFLVSSIILIPLARLSENKVTRKPVLIAVSLFSRVVWLGIILIPLVFIHDPLLYLLIFVTASAVGDVGSRINWISMMSDIVPENMRGHYFGRRNRIMLFASMLSIVIGGLFLDFYGPSGFPALFSFAMAAGIASMIFLAKYPSYSRTKKLALPPVMEEIKSVVRESAFRRFAALFFIFWFGVMMSSPFFVVRLLEYMKADYVWISVLTIVSGLAGIITLRGWGFFSDIYSHRSVLIVSAFLFTIYPLAWIFADSPWQIIPFEIISGASVAGLGLSQLNYLMETSREKFRGMFTALFTIMVGIASFTAPAIGGMIADYFAGRSFLGLTELEVVFFFSWVIRLAGAVLLLKFLLEAKKSKKYISARYVFMEMTKMTTHEGFRMSHIIVAKAMQEARRTEYMIEHAAMTVKKDAKEAEKVAEDSLRKIDEMLERIAAGIMNIERVAGSLVTAVVKADRKGAEKAAEVLGRGGIVVYPTETSYGIACDAINPDAIRKVYQIKGRDSGKPLPILVSDTEMAKEYAVIDREAEILIRKFMPGPLTIAVKKKGLPDELSKDTVALRISSGRFAGSMVKALGRPVTATSANMAGGNPIYRISEIKDAFMGRVDLIADAGNLKKRKPSTIYDVENREIVRAGKITKSRIQRLLAEYSIGQ